MKVLHVISDLSVAGAQKVVMSYLEGFYKNDQVDMSVAVIIENKNSSFEIEAKTKNYNIYHCNYNEDKRGGLISSILNWIKIQKELYRIISFVKPDIIHSHVTPILQYLLLPVFIGKVPIRVHTLHSDPFALSRKNRILGKLAFHFFRFFPICVTEGQSIKAQKAYHIKKYAIIKNGIDLERFQRNIPKSIARKRYGISEDSFVIGYVGRLNSIKNIPFLISVFHEFHNKNNKAILCIAGEGEEKATLQELIMRKGLSNSVRFLGLITDTELFYHMIDVFMITSFHESSSIVTVEAQLCGVHCVIADTIPKDVIISKQVNRLSLESPISLWVDAVEGKLGVANAEKTPVDYSINTSLLELEKLYSLLLSNRTKR